MIRINVNSLNIYDIYFAVLAQYILRVFKIKVRQSNLSVPLGTTSATYSGTVQLSVC